MRIAPKPHWLHAALCAALLLPFAPALRLSATEGGASRSAESKGDSNGEPVKYIGPGSCAATSCHGSVKPVAGSRILQNEYSTWIVKDRHSRAYQDLTGDIGERIARILKLNAKAEEAPKCLACHALYTTPEQRGRPFELSEGVSCENCHGPASAWLGPHTTRDWPHEKSVALGMRDTRDVIHRTEKCLECHLGTKEKFVDHEMIAAGHPDLFFELDSFSAVMPRHWKSPRESTPGKPVEDASWAGVRDWSAGQAVQLRAEMERLTSLPGVQSAALVSGLAPMRPPNMNDTEIEGFVMTKDGPIQNVDFYQAVSKDYFATMGIRLMDGRLFDERDVQDAPQVVIVNEAMAKTFWPNQNPIGRRVRPGKDWCTIVGVVDDVKNAGLDRPAGTELYLPFRQPAGAGQTDMYVVTRAQGGDPRALAGQVRQQMNEIDPSLPLADVRLMDDVLSRAQARPRFLTLLLTLFSVIALAIATVGIYGVVSYSVARRTKEFGLRMVLGAQTGDVLGLVMKQGAGMIAIGVACGLLLALFFTRLMASLLFGVTPTDLATFASVTAVLFGVALAACYIPARRATKVDPIQTLRYE